MRRTLLYILIPLIAVLGIAYTIFFYEQKNTKLESYVAQSDLVVFHIPHVFHRIKEDQNKSVFQHLLHLEGLDALNDLVVENIDQFDTDYLTDLTLIITEDYKFLLILDESKSSFSEKFWDGLTIENDLGVIPTENSKWFFHKDGGRIFCSNDETIVNRGETGNTFDLTGVNWKQNFIRFNKKITAENPDLSLTNFIVNWSDRRINLSGYQVSKGSQRSIGQVSSAFDFEGSLNLDLNQLDLLHISNGSDYFSEFDASALPKGFDSKLLNGSRIAKVNFRMPENKNASVFLIKTSQPRKLYDVFGASPLEVRKAKEIEFLKKCFPNLMIEKSSMVGVYQNLFVFGEEKEVVSYIDAIKKNSVWSYSIERMKWIEDELIPSNQFHLVNTNFFFNGLFKDSVSQNYIKRNVSVLSAIPYLVLQQSTEPNGQFTGMSVVLDENSTGYNYEGNMAIEQENMLEEKEIMDFPAILVSKPYPVKSHADQSLRFVLLDQKNNIYLANQNGSEDWKFELDGRLVGGVHEVDLFRNRKIQYLFATNKKIYCVDRLGRMVENFPVVLPDEKEIESFNLIDYDQSRNYRIAVTSENKIWLYNSEGKSLDGWNPKKLEAQVWGKIEHVRLGTKDYLLALETSGDFSLLHRNGDLYDNFPIKLGKNLLVNAVNVEKNKNEVDSYLSFVSSSGAIEKYDFEGKQIDKEGLIGVEKVDSIFVQNKRNDYRYFTLAAKKLDVYDHKHVIKYSTTDFNNITNVQSYNLSSIDVYAVFHEDGLTLITEEGKILIENIETNQPITLYYSRSQKKGYFYFSSKNKLKKTSFVL